MFLALGDSSLQAHPPCQPSNSANPPRSKLTRRTSPEQIFIPRTTKMYEKWFASTNDADSEPAPDRSEERRVGKECPV